MKHQQCNDLATAMIEEWRVNCNINMILYDCLLGNKNKNKNSETNSDYVYQGGKKTNGSKQTKTQRIVEQIANEENRRVVDMNSTFDVIVYIYLYVYGWEQS